MYNINDFIKSISFKNARNTKLIRDVINDYLGYVVDNVLNGYEYNIPKMGCKLCIYKNYYKDGEVPRISKAKLYTKGVVEYAYNPKTMGYYNSIELNGELLDKTGMKFKATGSFRKRAVQNFIDAKNYRIKV